MPIPILNTKLFIPAVRAELVPRPRLIDQLNAGVRPGCRLVLISAPAGFGKTSLISEWIRTISEATPPLYVAWLSLDEDDNDPDRFLSYFIAALNQATGIDATLGKEALAMLQSPQSPPVETILTPLINEIFEVTDRFVFVLDDYHVIESQPVYKAVSFLLGHLPPQFHLVMTTREDPQLPLARLRARNQLTELRAADLRFTLSEAAAFLNQIMHLNLSAEEIDALETRTEGWIAGLQMAAISMQGKADTGRFIASFTGSHHFVLDYLVGEVLHKQSESVQIFLLQTAVLDRLCGPLCNALTDRKNGQETLEILAGANLFILPLDNERRWYRYHHLFADLLRQRLHQSTAAFRNNDRKSVTELHLRASQWYEENGLGMDAFHHAVAANDVDRAAFLVERNRVFLQFAGTVTPVLNWLASLPMTILDATPSLWVMYASALTKAGKMTRVEPKLKAAEKALEGREADDKTQDLIGRIAAIRATLGIIQEQVETIIVQSRRALEFLRPDSITFRTTTNWTLGHAYQIQGDRVAAGQAFTEAISNSRMLGDAFMTIMATTGLGNVLESQNQLHLAAENYRRVLQLAGDPPLSVACEAHLGLARICYEWNDLDKAEQHARQGSRLGRQIDHVDTPPACEVIFARLKLARGDAAGAAEIAAKADEFVRQKNFVILMPEVAALQVLTLLHQGKLTAAARLAEKSARPVTLARVRLAQGETAEALTLLKRYQQEVEAKDWKEERLKVMVLQAVAFLAQGEDGAAVHRLGDALTLAEPAGCIRLFVDEGLPMEHLLSKADVQGITPNYTAKLLAAYRTEKESPSGRPSLSPERRPPGNQTLIEALTTREMEVLKLLGTELSGPEIAGKLFVSLTTIRTHTQNIYSKLGVNNRRAAVRRAGELRSF